MNPQDLSELMNAELDGVATPAQSDALNACLQSDQEARRQFELLKSAVEGIRNLPELEPPANLSTDILARIAWRKPASSSRVSKVFEAPMLRYAAAFALGMVLTGVILGPPSDAPGEWHRMAGTMAAGIEGTHGPTTRQSNFGSSGVSGSLQLQRTESFLVMAINLETENPFRLVVPLSDSLKVVGVLGAGEDAPTLELNGDQLDMQLGGGRRFAVLLSGAAERVPYRLYRDNELIFEDFLPVPTID